MQRKTSTHPKEAPNVEQMTANVKPFIARKSQRQNANRALKRKLEAIDNDSKCMKNPASEENSQNYIPAQDGDKSENDDDDDDDGETTISKSETDTVSETDTANESFEQGIQ